MNIFNRWVRVPGFALLAGLSVINLAGCDSSGLSEVDDAVAELNALDLVETVQMTQLLTEKEEEKEFLLEVTLREEETVRYPDAINLLGLSHEMPSTLLADDGLGMDVKAGDRIYSGIVPESCVPGGIPAEYASKDIIKITIACDWDLIRPGEECEGYGTCPSTAQRSWLWGLISYETNVVTCWCRGECNVELEFSL